MSLKSSFCFISGYGGFTWQGKLKASQVKILQRISNSWRGRIKVNSLYHSIAFKIFIKCIPCGWNLLEKLPSRVKNHKTMTMFPLFVWAFRQERQHSDWVSAAFLPLLVLGKKSPTPRYRHQPRWKQKELGFCYQRDKCNWIRGVCILWILVWICRLFTQGQKSFKTQKRSSLQKKSILTCEWNLIFKNRCILTAVAPAYLKLSLAEVKWLCFLASGVSLADPRLHTDVCSR